MACGKICLKTTHVTFFIFHHFQILFHPSSVSDVHRKRGPASTPHVPGTVGLGKTEITKNGYTRSSDNHFRVQRKSSTRTPPGRPLIGRTTVVPGSGSEQSGCTRCAEVMSRSTRHWLSLYPELVRSVQATRRRAHTRKRARVHTRPTLGKRISECTHDQPSGHGSPSAHTTNPQDRDLRRTSNIPIL